MEASKDVAPAVEFSRGGIRERRDELSDRARAAVGGPRGKLHTGRRLPGDVRVEIQSIGPVIVIVEVGIDGNRDFLARVCAEENLVIAVPAFFYYRTAAQQAVVED